MNDRIAANHLEMLQASGLTTESIRSRGYFTAMKKVELASLGFSAQQQLTPALVIPVFGPQGEVVLYQARPDQPRMRNGKIVKYETPAKSRMALDVPPTVRHLLGDPNVPLFITEGVKKADALATRGLCSVALLGVWNFRGVNDLGGKTLLAGFESIAVNGRNVFVVYDSDVMLKPAVAAAMSRLGAVLNSRDARTHYVYLPSGAAGEKVGVDDYLAAGHDVDDLYALATTELRVIPDGDTEDDEATSQTDMLVAIGREQDLFHDPQGTPFARVHIDGHLETWSLGSKSFKRWLQRQYFRQHAKAPGKDGVGSALGVLEGLAVFEGPEHALSVRVARHEDAIWYDLGDARWRAVRIDARGWEIVDDPPPIFRRYAHQQAQVVPLPGGDLMRLFDFLNVHPASRTLLACWLITAFVPDVPHPIPDFHGEKGAGKSVGQRVLRRLIDPSSAETLSFSSDTREVVQQFAHHYCPLYDNLDGLPIWLSDLLCRAVTGDGFSKRELYSDDDDVIYSYRRVILINGVNVIAQRSDLLDRSILIELMRIAPEVRREEREFWANFEAIRPHLLGAIFDALSRAIAVYERVQLPTLQRMADFTRWGAAAAEALGMGADAFVRAYAENLAIQTREAVEGDLVGSAVMALMDADDDDWSGTPTELLEALERVGETVRLFRRNASGKVDARGWPGAPHILSRRLKQVMSNLADFGVTLESERGDNRTITIRRVASQGGESSVGTVGSDEADSIPRGAPDATDATDGEITTFGSQPAVSPSSVVARPLGATPGVITSPAPHEPDAQQARDVAAAWRSAVRELGDLAGHPALPYKPGHSVGPGAATWGRFIAKASVPQLRLVEEALRTYLAAMPNPNSVDSPDLPGGDQCPM